MKINIISTVIKILTLPVGIGPGDVDTLLEELGLVMLVIKERE